MRSPSNTHVVIAITTPQKKKKKKPFVREEPTKWNIFYESQDVLDSLSQFTKSNKNHKILSESPYKIWPTQSRKENEIIALAQKKFSLKKRTGVKLQIYLPTFFLLTNQVICSHTHDKKK